jgi:hypothetical protein
MSNIPFCTNLNGAQIISSYNETTTHTGTVEFTSIPNYKAFTSTPYIFITPVYTGVGMFSTNITARSINSFSYAKYYNGDNNAAGEFFYWMAIGSTGASGNVPFVANINGVKIITGYDSLGANTGTITFTDVPEFSATPYVHMSLVTGTENNFTINLKTVSKNNFTYGKYYNGTNKAYGEDFYWIAIGPSYTSGNVPINKMLNNSKIIFGDYTEAPAVAHGTVNIGEEFTSAPHILLNINRGGYDVGYTINLTSVSNLTFGFVKNYQENSFAPGERFQWMAIGN